VLKNRPLLLILVCLALGVLVFLDNRPTGKPGVTPSVQSGEPEQARADDQTPGADAAAAAQASDQLLLHNPLATFDEATLKNWVERPLFAPSRQRPAAVAAAAQPSVRQAGPKLAVASYDLLGILRDGERAIALLRKKGEGTSFRVEVGDMIGGWRVARMEAASVVLEREDGTSQTVALSRQ
jgi:hypothetical protein